jgi:hypothetical protein
MENGGDTWVIGAKGTLEFESGATVTGLEAAATFASVAEAKAGTVTNKNLAPASLSQGAATLPDGSITPMFVQHYQIAPDAISATAVHAAVTLGAEAQDVTTGITAPDVPRTLTVKGNAAEITGNVVITGTNLAGEEITDTIALSGASEVEGIKAFVTVTNINFPAKVNESGDTVSVGIAKKFGLPHIVENAAMLLVKLFDGSTDSGSLAVDADEIEKNLFALNGAPNGSKKLDLFYMV